MRSEILAALDAHWAARLNCDPTVLRNHDTNIVANPDRTGAEVWLFDKTCVISAEPELARALKTSVGSRNPVVAFEPSRLREAVSEFGIEVHSPESVMAYRDCENAAQALTWIPPTDSEAELGDAVRVAADTGIPMITIPLNRRPARRAAEASGFKLYATVIYIGNKPDSHP
jgi:hypothetical protein